VLATTIVVARTEDEIVIGADSKVTDTFGNEVNRRACKILQVGELFVAFEGLAVDRQTNFNVQDIAMMALRAKQSKTVVERVSILTGLLVTRLFDEMAHMRKNEPEAYNKRIEGGQVFLRVVITSFEKGRPVIFVRNFRAARITQQQFGITVVPDDCLDDCHGEVVTRFLGETEAIDGLPEETPGFWQSGIVDGVRRLIQTEIDARSEYVGPPIDFVRINKNGVQWIQKKPECSGIRNNELRNRGSAGKKRN
jgi:hypothetical protein